MKVVPFGAGQASAVIAGMMRIVDLSDEEIRSLYDRARAADVDFFDHADIYGGRMHACEERFGTALKLSSSERREILLQTKCGIVPEIDGYDLSHHHIVRQVEGSLRALQTDYVDVLLLHRPDALGEPDDIAKAFDELASSGKVRSFGVSNHTPRQIELLRASVSQPLIVNQLQFSLSHAAIIGQPIATNVYGERQSVVTDGGGIVEYCRTTKVTIQAWSPMQAADLSGTFIGNPAFRELNTVLDRFADKYQVTPTGIAAAWVTRHPANMQVVMGTTNADRLEAASEGSDIALTRAEWYELFRAAGHLVP